MCRACNCVALMRNHTVAWVLNAGVLAMGLTEGIWGALQLFGVVDSDHPRYPVTGSFYNPGPVICQYQDVVCDTNTIYALYFGEPSDMFKDLHGCYWVHEFDWDGNFKAKYHLPVPILSIWLDPSNNTLYGYNLEEDGLYKLNISSH